MSTAVAAIICLVFGLITGFVGFRLGYNKGVDECDDPVENVPSGGSGGIRSRTQKH